MKKMNNQLKSREYETEDFNFHEEEWYYDELEQIWKKIPGAMTLKRILCLAVPGGNNCLTLHPGR